MIARENVLERFFSVDIGCVSLTRNAFGAGEIRESHFRDAVDIAGQCFKPVSRQLTDSFLNWKILQGNERVS